MKNPERPAPGPWGALLALLLLPGPLFPRGRGGEAPPSPGDFAGSLALGGREDSLLRFEIPEELYQGIEGPGMADVRVFDAQGLPVPFSIRPVPPRMAEVPPADLSFFPWAEEQEDSFPGATDIVIDTEGAVLSIKSRGKGPGGIRAWLLDLSGLSPRPRALSISLGEEGELYNTTAQIYSSADLARWESFGKPQALAYFGGAGRETLELPPGENRYLLLRLDKPGLPPRKISALFGEREIPPAPREKVIAGSWLGEGRRIARYNTGGFYPIRALGFSLPQADSFEALVKYRYREEEEWRVAARASLFRVSSGAGGILESGALEIGISAPYWELEAPGAMAALPGLKISWAVYELIFLGRGRGPWTLAWGSGHGPPEEFSLPPGISADAIEDARALGSPVYQAGGRRTPRDRDWGSYILWGILILAALILSGLALYIAKSMEKERT